MSFFYPNDVAELLHELHWPAYAIEAWMENQQAAENAVNTPVSHATQIKYGSPG